MPETTGNSSTPTPPVPPLQAAATPPAGGVTADAPIERAPGERVLTPEQELQAVELAAAGVPYRRIGQMLGVSHVTAWRTVQRALRDHHDERWSNLKEFIARESLRLDRLDQVWLPRALRGEKDAAVIVLRTQASRVRLAAAAGLTGTQKPGAAGGSGGVLLDQEIQELLEALAANDVDPDES